MMDETQSRPAFRIRGETRLKNARLVEAREEVGMTQAAFAKHVGIPAGDYNAYENMREYPRPKHAKILSEFCNCTLEELFPVELKKYAEGEEPRKLLQMAEIEPSRLLGPVRREALLAPAPTTPEDDLEAATRQDQIHVALSQLGEKEREVLTKYFGLDGEEPMTLQEISAWYQEHGISRGPQRIGQIKEKALAQLRRKQIALPLEQFHREVSDAPDFIAPHDEIGKDGVVRVGRLRAWCELQRQQRIG